MISTTLPDAIGLAVLSAATLAPLAWSGWIACRAWFAKHFPLARRYRTKKQPANHGLDGVTK